MFIAACHSTRKSNKVITGFRDVRLTKVFDRYSILEILAGDVCFVNLFRTILPVVPTACDVLIVCRQHNDKEWKFTEQHAKMWENIAGAKRYSRPRGFNIAGAIERPRRPRRSDASAVADRKVRARWRAKCGSGACSGRVYVPSNCFRAAVPMWFV